jgi:hypothetical protein
MSPLRHVVRQWLAEKVPADKDITSDGDRQAFFELTNYTHEGLIELWKAEGKKPKAERKITTTCNAFTGVYSKLHGLGNLGGIDPYGLLKERDRLRAWVPAGGSDVPQPGDIVQFITKWGYHVAVSFTRGGLGWVTVDAGQGGPQFITDAAGTVVDVKGHDVIRRKGRDFAATALKGWIDIDVYYELHNRVPAATEPAREPRTYWLTEQGRSVHPGAPAGRRGPGGFRPSGPVAAEARHRSHWHPDAPAAPARGGRPPRRAAAALKAPCAAASSMKPATRAVTGWPSRA